MRTLLKDMSPVWRRRFLTWGILIAVFGMRLILPLAIVAIAAGIGPIAALKMAVFEPRLYAHVIEGSHLQIAAFGGDLPDDGRAALFHRRAQGGGLVLAR